MQSKGVIRLVAIVIALACVYQLSFTWVTRREEQKAKEYALAVVGNAAQDPDFSADNPLNKTSLWDSLVRITAESYLDSMSAEKIFIGFTYKECKEKELNLGLDLKGGMNVTLEVSVVDIVRSMSNYNASPQLSEAIALAQKNQAASRSDFVTLFGEAWNVVAPNQRLASIFGTYELRERIKPETSNADVLKIIRDDAESAIANSFNVLRNRIDRFGVTQPNIQRLGSSGRILVELPGVKEPDRVRKLLQGTASLEFWATYENSELYEGLLAANRLMKEANAGNKENEELAEPDSLANQDWTVEYPLFALLHPSVDQNGQLLPGACIGMAHYRDTGRIMNWLRMPQVRALFPRDFRPMWSVKASKQDPSGVSYELVAIKANTRDGRAPLDGGVITDARKDFSQLGAANVSMSMNNEGARIWARLTADNINKCIAIVLDGAVYSNPRVNDKIEGGHSQITGDFTVTETEDLANVLKSGKLPAPARIVQEAVVGPTLGQESINAGFISFALAFVMVLIYMLFFYNFAGVVANVALLCNMLFIFGALASFGAVLTLPGIAGIVLTLGMAVDANVIIYERIKEELRAGKGLRLAITDGYKNAYSAIIDGNLTTIIVGIVLFFFGSGPVQGFATTLVVGIITSMVTSIFVTRLIFEWRLGKGKQISFDNTLTRNFLADTKYDFIRVRKIAYIVSISAIVIAFGSIFTKGFSYGVDFTGGRTYVVRFDQQVSLNDVRTALLDEFQEATEVKQFGAESQVKVTTSYKINDESSAVDSLVDTKLYNALKGFFSGNDIPFAEFISTIDNPNGVISSEKVGPTIADDLKRDAVVAVIIAMLAIFLYIASRFRNWYWGLGGLLSLAHDAVFVVGFFSLFSGILPFSLDVDQTFIAAVLTIIGYSINDSVVIFDRIREYHTLYPKRDLQININEALNSTLSRTVNTAGTTLVVLIMIAIFGGEVIRGFSVALIIGVLVGTYSSVFVATPVVYDFYRRKQKKTEGKSEKK
ncbi:MAG: protein translocase subunit SecDF [Prevotellaceae bacterium]|jgi:SecD/SecF fusion protein|nr:protein translocase subunit SecDF [Prevotellaceae bacterium]